MPEVLGRRCTFAALALRGTGRGLEKSRAGQPLVAANEATKALGDGEGEHEVMAGKLPVDPAFEPLAGFKVLTGGAVAIAAGAMHP